MHSKTKTIVGILIFIVFLGLAYYAYNHLKDSNLPENITAPSEEKNQPDAEQQTETSDTDAENKLRAFDFTVYDGDGNAVNLSDFSDKPIIVNFWASWCGFCVQEMPDFEEKYQEYGEEIYFLMVDCVDGQRETQEKGGDFISDNGFTFPVYYDLDQSATKAYEAYSLPTSVFIDKDGYIIAYQPGMLTSEMLQKGIDFILTQEE